MSIPPKVIQDFSPETCRRGQYYWARGAVNIVNARPGLVEARVRGTRLYRTEVRWSSEEYEFDCTCPYFADRGEPCKHIWATLLSADKAGLLLLRPRDDGSTGVTIAGTDQPNAQTIETPPQPPRWMQTIHRLRNTTAKHAQQLSSLSAPASMPDDRRIVYLIDVAATIEQGRGLIVEVATQKQNRDSWERLKAFGFDLNQWLLARDERDRLLAQMLVGARSADVPYFLNQASGTARRFIIPGASYSTTLRMMCETGRCGLRFEHKQDDFVPLQWDDAGAWDFAIEIAPRPDGERVAVSGILRRSTEAGTETATLDQPRLLMAEGLAIFEDRIAPLRHHGAWPILQALRDGTSIHAATTQVDDLIRELVTIPNLPPLEIHPSFEVTHTNLPPQPRLILKRPGANARYGEMLLAELSFVYGGSTVTHSDTEGALFDAANRRLIVRDRELEHAALRRVLALGCRNEWMDHGCLQMTLPVARLHHVVMALTTEGWDVQAEGSLYRRAGNVRVDVSSGIDWFELNGGVEFDGKLVSLPRLLAAAKSGEKTIKLDDGSIGLLPMEWLEKYAPLVGLGEAQDESLRFEQAQVSLLDALLLTMPEVRVDETFARARDQMRAFEKIEPIDAPPGFVGTLRPYQNDGLGWLMFLQRFSFGGCLADDMGLGKTVQVLALLESRREMKAGPSLVVVPRSLVFNWKAEAQRFAPQLRLLDHTGITRTRAADHFSQFDLIVTTYGTLRRDAAYFKDETFDYVILDEAQAIKNSTTEAAKAVRLLKGSHRLALSGTPIENRLAELWSLFEFLNPGMLGAVSVFRNLIGNGQELEGRHLLSRALRPFILRRTKAQVAKDLPEKLEQTIQCDLEPPQRALYDELREHYRQSLMGVIEAKGIKRSKIQILEALLRLRQAACHPGLIDKSRANEGSAKLDSLLLHLNDVVAEDHKALVFSQFTSFLSIVRKRLDDAGTVYEYLDGKTRDRQQRVDRFQTDDKCRLFLISLKAGGLGLNLTAADYVFLLDPWWNPAVEAQAIDRTHRIGQTRRVFAYRLIARDTVEEKVLQLQQTKRDLADAIITADNSVISSLGKQELELLLS